MRRFVCCSLIAGAFSAVAEWTPGPWPALREYDGEHVLRVALPLGGIGTGTVSLGGRGELRDWEIMNRPAKGYFGTGEPNEAPFVALSVRTSDGRRVSRMAAGPLADCELLHCEGQPVPNHGLPRFSKASFRAAYPFKQKQAETGSCLIGFW